MKSHALHMHIYIYIFSREPSTYHSYRTPTTPICTYATSLRSTALAFVVFPGGRGARGGIYRRAESMADEPMTANNNGEERPPEAVLVVPIKPPTRAAAFQAAALPLGMVMVQVLTVVMLLLSKLALNTGMRPAVLIVYRNLIAAAAVAPLAFVFERY